MTAVITKFDIVPYGICGYADVAQVCRPRTFPILFNRKDANVVIGCHFIVFDTGWRISRLYMLNLPERPVDYLLCVA